MSTPAIFAANARDIDDIVAVLAASEMTPAGGADSPRYTQLDHALQCASVLYHAFPDDDELQIAGLLHDIGHILRPGAPESHGEVGASWIADFLGPRVCALIRLHVDAKRYLITTNAGYRGRLSAASARTLILQGDKMTVNEVDTFRADPNHRDAIVLRRADERAKVEGLNAGQIGDWVPVISLVSEKHR